MGCIESKAVLDCDEKANLPTDSRLHATKPSLTIIHDNEPDDVITLWSKVAEAMYFDVHLVSLNYEKLEMNINENLQKQTNHFQDTSAASTADPLLAKKNFNVIQLQNQIYSNVITVQEILAEKLSGLTVEIVLVDMRNSKRDLITNSICHYFRILYPNGSDIVLVALISKVTSGGIKCPNDSIPSDVISNGFNKYFVCSNNLSSIVRELFIFNCNEISYLRKLRSQSSGMSRPTTGNNPPQNLSFDENCQIPDLRGVNLQSTSSAGLAAAAERMKTIHESDGGTFFNDEKRNSAEASSNQRRMSTRNSIVSGSSSLGQQKRLSGSFHDFPASEKVNLMTNRKKWSISFINRMTNYILNEREFKLRLFQAIKRPRRNKRSSSTDIESEKTLFGRRKESWARIQSYGSNSSLSRVIQVLQNAQLSCGPQASKELQSALDILLSNDLFCGILKCDQNMDKPTDEFISGLLTNVDRQKQNDRKQAKKSVVNLSITLQDIPLEYQEALEKDNKWDFDVINLERVTDKKPLLYLGMKIFQRFEICSFLKCPQITANHWLTLIEQNYLASNTYHNSTHAADVMQSCAYLLQKESLQNAVTQEDIVATVLAAIIHDVDHPGKTNQFLVTTKHPLALLYNDIAVLEHHHASHAFKLTLGNSNCDIFANMENGLFKALRSQMINLVLATELSVHNNHLSQFISVLSQPMIARQARLEDSSSLNSQLDIPEEVDPTMSKSQLNRIFLTELLESEENKMILKRMIIKCSDVNNPTRSLELCKLWAERIANEYFDQIDEEIRLGFETLTMPPFNRKTCNLAMTQLKFIEFFLTKMFPALDSVVDCPELMENFESNLNYWRKESEANTRTV